VVITVKSSQVQSPPILLSSTLFTHMCLCVFGTGQTVMCCSCECNGRLLLGLLSIKLWSLYCSSSYVIQDAFCAQDDIITISSICPPYGNIMTAPYMRINCVEFDV